MPPKNQLSDVAAGPAASEENPIQFLSKKLEEQYGMLDSTNFNRDEFSRGYISGCRDTLLPLLESLKINIENAIGKYKQEVLLRLTATDTEEGEPTLYAPFFTGPQKGLIEFDKTLNKLQDDAEREILDQVGEDATKVSRKHFSKFLIGHIGAEPQLDALAKSTTVWKYLMAVIDPETGCYADLFQWAHLCESLLQLNEELLDRCEADADENADGSYLLEALYDHVIGEEQTFFIKSTHIIADIIPEVINTLLQYGEHLTFLLSSPERLTDIKEKTAREDSEADYKRGLSLIDRVFEQAIELAETFVTDFLDKLINLWTPWADTIPKYVEALARLESMRVDAMRRLKDAYSSVANNYRIVTQQVAYSPEVGAIEPVYGWEKAQYYAEKIVIYDSQEAYWLEQLIKVGGINQSEVNAFYINQIIISAIDRLAELIRQALMCEAALPHLGAELVGVPDWGKLIKQCTALLEGGALAEMISPADLLNPTLAGLSIAYAGSPLADGETKKERDEYQQELKTWLLYLQGTCQLKAGDLNGYKKTKQAADQLYKALNYENDDPQRPFFNLYFLPWQKLPELLVGMESKIAGREVVGQATATKQKRSAGSEGDMSAAKLQCPAQQVQALGNGAGSAYDKDVYDADDENDDVANEGANVAMPRPSFVNGDRSKAAGSESPARGAASSLSAVTVVARSHQATEAPENLQVTQTRGFGQ